MEALQRLGDENAVLPQERHDVRHRRQPRHHEQRPPDARSLVDAAALGLADDAIREQKGDPRPAQVLQVLRRGHLRIDDGIRVRQLLAGQMVVRHHDRTPLALEVRDLGDGIDAVVDGDHKSDARIVLQHAGNRSLAHAVALGEPVRNELGDRPAKRPQRPRHDGRRADAVAVVVAEHDDLPPIDDGIEDKVRRLDDAGKLFRLRQLVDRRLQVKLEVRGRYAAILEEFCHNRAHFTSKHHLCLSSRTPYWMPWTVS